MTNSNSPTSRQLILGNMLLIFGVIVTGGERSHICVHVLAQTNHSDRS